MLFTITANYLWTNIVSFSATNDSYLNRPHSLHTESHTPRWRRVSLGWRWQRLRLTRRKSRWKSFLRKAWVWERVL